MAQLFFRKIKAGIHQDFYLGLWSCINMPANKLWQDMMISKGLSRILFHKTCLLKAWNCTFSRKIHVWKWGLINQRPKSIMVCFHDDFVICYSFIIWFQKSFCFSSFQNWIDNYAWNPLKTACWISSAFEQLNLKHLFCYVFLGLQIKLQDWAMYCKLAMYVKWE